MSAAVALLFSVWLSVPTHTVTPEFMIFAVLFGLGAAIGSGYLTALAAPGAPFAHALGLAALSVIAWGVSTFGHDTPEPLWFRVANLTSVLSGILIGGYLRQWQIANKAEAPKG
jgi:hypothetical protein